jgi:hypothetical protein
LNLREFIRHLLIRAIGADSALQLALSYINKRGETEVEDITEPSTGFRSYLGNLARSVLENAEELCENRSTRRKQSLCVVVDLINNEGLSTFKGQRSKENTLTGLKSKIKASETSEGVFQRSRGRLVVWR